MNTADECQAQPGSAAGHCAWEGTESAERDSCPRLSQARHRLLFIAFINMPVIPDRYV